MGFIRSAATVIVSSLVITAFVNTERTFIAPCAVTLRSGAGKPVSHVRVSENWNAYSDDLSGGGEVID